MPDRWLPAAVWVLAAYTACGVILNSISQSPIERAIMVPVALGMSALSFTVAIALRRRKAIVVGG